jgi:hypothetical protein
MQPDVDMDDIGVLSSEPFFEVLQRIECMLAILFWAPERRLIRQRFGHCLLIIDTDGITKQDDEWQFLA